MKTCTDIPRIAWAGFLLAVLMSLLAGVVSIAVGDGPEQKGETDLLKQAQVYEREQNYAAAESVYRTVLASDRNNPEALKRLGIVKQTELKFNDSIELFKLVLHEHPDYPQVDFFLGLSYYGQHDPNAAIASFHQELKTSSPHPATRYYLALALETIGRTDEAIDELNRVAPTNPNNADVLYGLARLHVAAAFRAIDRLRKLDPDSFQMHAFTGQLYSEEGQYEAAAGEFQAALRKQPDALGIHYPLGTAYRMLHEYESAEKEFLLALLESPDDPGTNLSLGELALRVKQYDKALPYLQTAAAGRSKDVESHLLLGRCYMGLGESQHAEAEFLLAASLDPTGARSHYFLAQVYEKLNQPSSRQRELALFNKLSSVQKANESNTVETELEHPR